MKKILIILLLVIITGCGNKKTLVCNKNSDLGKQTLTFNYKDGVLKDGQIKYVITVNNEELIEARKEIEESFKENFADFELKISDNNKDTIVVILEFNSNNISKIMGNSVNTNTYTDIKNKLIKENFTCN